MMFTLVSLYVTAVFLERMVMPRSRSRSLLSITRVSTFSLSRNTLLCASIESTSVVLPWSTCAMMATLRTSLRGARPAAAASGSATALLRTDCARRAVCFEARPAAGRRRARRAPRAANADMLVRV